MLPEHTLGAILLPAAILSARAPAATADIDPFRLQNPVHIEPTPAPRIPRNVRHLMGRADDDEDEKDTTVLVRSDATCGYINGEELLSFMCAKGSNCAIFQGNQHTTGHVACCQDGTCYTRLACMDDEAYSSGSCDANCASDYRTVKCTESAAPHCLTYNMLGNVREYGCTKSSAPRQTVLTSFSGGRALSYSTSIKKAGASTTTDSVSSSETAPPIISTRPDKDSDTANSNDDSGTTSDPSPAETQSSSSNTGAIVGGAVGGAAALALLIAGIFIWRKKRQNSQDPNAGNGLGPHNTPLSPPGPPPSTMTNNSMMPGASPFPPGPNMQQPQQQYHPLYQPNQQYYDAKTLGTAGNTPCSLRSPGSHYTNPSLLSAGGPQANGQMNSSNASPNASHSTPVSQKGYVTPAGVVIPSHDQSHQPIYEAPVDGATNQRSHVHELPAGM